MHRLLGVAVVASLVTTLGVITSGNERASAQVQHATFADPLGGSGTLISDPTGAIAQARKSVANGDLPGAIKRLAIYVAGHPKELAPARYLGDLYYRNGDIKSAERTYVSALTFAPNDAETHDRLGGVYAAQDMLKEAIAEFTKSLPTSAAYGHLAEVHRRLGDLDQFELNARRAADAAPDDPVAQYAIGTIYLAEGKAALSVPYLERTLVLDRASCPALAELGSAYIDLERLDDAQSLLMRCLAIDANDYAANVNLGDVYIQRSKIGAARALFERANKTLPEGPEALVDLGYLEDLDAHWEAAVRYYLRAISADPLQRDAYVDLGYDYNEHGLFALAEAAYLKGLSVAPADGRLHYLLGHTYADQGKRELARSEYRHAAESSDPGIARAATFVLTSL